MRRSAARLCAILFCLTGLGAIQAAPASAAVAGIAVQITELPGEFAAGSRPETVTVVAASERAGDRCIKVRWSMVMQVSGIRLDQISVNRVEDDGAFPVSVRENGDTARLTDVQLDPGALCPDRTVTARYEVAVDEDVPDGSVSFLAEAYDVNERLLQRANARREVVSGQVQQPSPDVSPSPSEDSEGASADDGADDQTSEASEAPGTQSNTALPVSGVPERDSGLAKVGLVVGGVFVFLGVGLLMKLRRRAAKSEGDGSGQPGRFAAYRRRRYS